MYSKMHILSSETLDRELVLYVSLPETYGNPRNQFPVLYVMDGDTTKFILAATLVRQLAWIDHIPEMIVVGIGYGVEDRSAEWLAARSIDLTPTPTTEFPGSGGADDFLAALRDEVIPFIDSIFTTDRFNRGLLGHSFGGLFALYALLEEPTLFTQIISSSASLWYDSDYLVRAAADATAHPDEAAPRVYLALGEDEGLRSDRMTPERYIRFIAALSSSDWDDERVLFELFQGEDHITVMPAAFSRGLRYCYQDLR